PGLTIVEPFEDRFTSQSVKFLEGRQGLLALDPADLVDADETANRYRSDELRAAWVGRRRSRGVAAQSLLSLMDPGRIEPEFGILRHEDARARGFAHASFADDDRLAALEQGVADAGPFLESHTTGLGLRNYHSDSTLGSRPIKSVTASRGDFPSNKTRWSSAV